MDHPQGLGIQRHTTWVPQADVWEQPSGTSFSAAAVIFVSILEAGISAAAGSRLVPLLSLDSSVHLFFSASWSHFPKPKLVMHRAERRGEDDTRKGSWHLLESDALLFLLCCTIASLMVVVVVVGGGWWWWGGGGGDCVLVQVIG